ncbi:hypothetical protein ABT213_31285 [Streptomyces sp. NPDC001674]|uniref:TIGR02391 family protein n=1 Tax=Streptomyces sp. NPDC001674 TaxID=3154394 RepID=UPI00333320D1
MATYGAEYLRRLLAAVDRFEQVFEQWMETQVESDYTISRGLWPTVWTEEGQDEATVRRLELDVAEAAGAAARAVAVTGAGIGVAGIAARVRGRLRTMIDEAETVSDSTPPGFAPSELHEVIWTAAGAHWTTHQYRVAVREASEALTVHWKKRLGRNDVTTPGSGNRVFRRVSLRLIGPSLHGPGTPPTRRPRACEADWSRWVKRSTASNSW